MILKKIKKLFNLNKQIKNNSITPGFIYAPYIPIIITPTPNELFETIKYKLKGNVLHKERIHHTFEIIGEKTYRRLLEDEILLLKFVLDKSPLKLNRKDIK